MSKIRLFHLSDVRICCFSLLCILVNWISVDFGLFGYQYLTKSPEAPGNCDVISQYFDILKSLNDWLIRNYQQINWWLKPSLVAGLYCMSTHIYISSIIQWLTIIWQKTCSKALQPATWILTESKFWTFLTTSSTCTCALFMCSGWRLRQYRIYEEQALVLSLPHPP